MFEFNCPQCATSIKANDEYVGKIGRCNKCGKSFTVPAPAAENIEDIADSILSESAAVAEIAAVETCENCGRRFGKLETPMRWNSSWVCGPCYQILLGPKRTEGIERTSGAPRKNMYVVNGDPIVCANPNCGYIGGCHKKARGSRPLAFFLFLCGGFPGLIYCVVCSG